MKHRPGLVVALVVAAACVDPAGPEERFGQVSLRATFATGETPADFGVAVESILVRIERSGDAAALVDTVIGYVEGEVSTWVLDLLADEELLSVDMELLGGSTLLYQGNGEVTARAGEIGETDIQGVPVLYRGPPATDSVVVAPISMTMAAIGDQAQLQATALGRDGSVLSGKTFAWSSSVPGVATVDDQGLVRALQDGLTTITATVDGVSGSASVTVEVVAAVVTSTIDAAPDTLPADGMSQAGVTVRLLDANGNPLEKSGGNVTLATTLGSLSPVTDHDDGTYTAVLTSTVAGPAIITGELGGNPIADNALVTFRAGPPAPGTATIGAQPDSAPADGASPVTITVRLFDANGNPLATSGGTVVLGSTLGSLSPVTDHDDGTYTAVLTSTVAGPAIITGELGGNPIADNALVTFRAGPPAPGTATIGAQPDSAPADGASPVTITVRLFDANGNPLATSGGTVVLGSTLGSLSPVTDHDDGTYTATLTSGQLGTALVSGLLDGVPLADTATVAFVAGPASPLTSTLRADPRRVTDLVKGTVIIVRLFDAQGNRLSTSGGIVTLATTLGTLGPVVDRGDGTYTATLQSGVPGTAIVTGTLNGVPMKATDSVQFVGP